MSVVKVNLNGEMATKFRSLKAYFQCFFFFVFFQTVSRKPNPPKGNAKRRSKIGPCIKCGKDGKNYHSHVSECYKCLKCGEFKTGFASHDPRCNAPKERKMATTNCPECHKVVTKNGLPRHRRDIHGIMVRRFIEVFVIYKFVEYDKLNNH